MRTDPRLSLAIPYYLRSMRGSRAPNWVETPQGQVLQQVENRLQQILVEEGNVHLLPLILDELHIIGARATALAVPENQRKVSAASVVRDTETAEKIKKAKKLKVAVEETKPSISLNQVESMCLLMKQYIDTGDITAIVPTGSFASVEEKNLWSFFTMAEIKSVKGRTINATKLSNGKPVDAMVIAEGVQVEGTHVETVMNTPVVREHRRYALLQDPTGESKMIVAAIRLPNADAIDLSRIFNSLYRSAT